MEDFWLGKTITKSGQGKRSSESEEVWASYCEIANQNGRKHTQFECDDGITHC